MYRFAYSELSLFDRLMLHYKFWTDDGYDDISNILHSYINPGNYWVLLYENDPEKNHAFSWIDYNVMNPNPIHHKEKILDVLGWEQVIPDEIELPVEKRIMYCRVGPLGAKIDGIVYWLGDYWLDLGDLEKVKINGQLIYKFLDTYLIEKTESIIKNKVITRLGG